MRKTKQPRTYQECRIMLACDSSEDGTAVVEWGRDYPRTNRGDNAGRWGRQQLRAYLNLLKGRYIEVLKTERAAPGTVTTWTRTVVRKTADWELWKKGVVERRKRRVEWLEQKTNRSPNMEAELHRRRREGLTWWLPAKRK